MNDTNSSGNVNANRCDFVFVQSTTEIGGAEITLLNLLASSEELRRRSLVASLGFGAGELPARLRSAAWRSSTSRGRGCVTLWVWRGWC